MVDGPGSIKTLEERCQELREHRLRVQRAKFVSDGHVWPIATTASRRQVLVCDGIVVHAEYRDGGYQVEIRHPPGSSSVASEPRRIRVPVNEQSRLEAVDLTQDLLVVSEVVDATAW